MKLEESGRIFGVYGIVLFFYVRVDDLVKFDNKVLIYCFWLFFFMCIFKLKILVGEEFDLRKDLYIFEFVVLCYFNVIEKYVKFY